jgi:hypothetical protein
MTKKLFSSQNLILEYGYQNNPEFYADFETVEINAKNLLTKRLQAKEVCKTGVCPLRYYGTGTVLTCKSFWLITFFVYTFSQLFPQILNFWVIEYIYKYYLELVECNSQDNGFINQLKNFFNKHF